jgi:hypothetical protein
MKKFLILTMVFLFGCAEMQVMNQFHRRTALDFLIFRRIKEALNNGISKQVTKLTATDGFTGMKQ